MIRGALVAETRVLRALAPAWWALWRRCVAAGAAASPFQTPAWLLPWWDAFATGPLAVATAWDGDTLVGLAPFFLDVDAGRLRPLGVGVSDILDILIDPADPAATGAVLMDAFALDDRWTTLGFEELPPGAMALGLVPPGGCGDGTAPQSVSPVLPLPAGAEDAQAVVPAAWRRKLRMARHRAARRGCAVEWARAETAAVHLDHLFRLHASRWTERGEAGVLADPRVQAFHRASVPGLAAHGLLRSAVARIGGAVAGVFHGFAAGGVVYAYLGGFDPAFAFESPGTVLIGAAIDAALREGAHAFSFLRGAEPYKYAWGARDETNLRRTFERGLDGLG